MLLTGDSTKKLGNTLGSVLPMKFLHHGAYQLFPMLACMRAC